ncbi:hypothetical protein PN36_02710 [Candidatus Thiomargarita nelsonii]|uniref:O-antigen ligase-related domain-containing protein n=1 Tax=Candidatus Thiomargarita nelsonii TaxID=1003181 RepID=A0A0A6PEB4_9GAMM|nr:hypothetical protein PN36_02710 [Candidatus Thiomargarita nelsonii]
MKSIFQINLYYFLLAIYFFSFLFSNLISRIIGYNINVIFYISWLLVSIYSLKYLKWDKTNLLLLLVIMYFFVYLFDIRSPITANIFTIKDFLIPLASFYIGFILIRYTHKAIDIINLLIFPFLIYGLIQEISFYVFTLEQFLPWDAAYIQSLNEAGPHNFFQGRLLRFFGPMNSFVEFQVLTIFILSWLVLNKKFIMRKKLLQINLILGISVILLTLERSPIFIAIIMIFFWKLKYIITNIGSFFKAISILTFIIVLIFLNRSFLENHPMTSTAYYRLYDVVTLNLFQDAAVIERTESQWDNALQLAYDNHFGIGLGRMSPSAKTDDYIAPHNNFLAYYLAYGLIGFLIFCSFLLYCAWNLFIVNKEYGYFGIGLIASSSAMAMFNMPFSGKQGIIIFMILGFLMANIVLDKLNFRQLKSSNASNNSQ